MPTSGQDITPSKAQQMAAWSTFKAEQGEDWTIRWNEKTGLPRTITKGKSDVYRGSAEAAARAFLTDYANLFGFKNDLSDLEHLKTTENRDGLQRVTFQQYYQGIPIEGAEYKIHVFKNGRIGMVNGFYYQNIEISASPTSSSSQAIEVAKGDLALTKTTGEANTTELVVFPKQNGSFALAWKTLIFAEEPFTDWLYFIDAHTRDILEKQNRMMDVIGTGKVYLSHPGISSVTPTVNFYRLNGNGYLQGTYVNVLNDVNPRAYSASHNFQYNTASTHFDEANLYYHVDRFRHNFINNLGNLSFTQITAHAHTVSVCGGGTNNACFSPGTKHIYFGDGTGEGYNSFAQEDKIIYHEYVHAVIHDLNSAILSDHNEMGAISEGVSDYLSGSFTGRSVIGDYAQPNSRDMNNPSISTYAEYEHERDNVFPLGGVIAHYGGEFFSSILWDIRNNPGIASSHVDYLVLDAIEGISTNPDFLEFRDAMMTADSFIHSELIQNTFAAKGVGHYASLPPSAPTGISITNAGTRGSPILYWNANPEPDIDYYEVWRQQKQLSPVIFFSPLHIASPTSNTFTDTFLIMDMFSHPNDWRYAISAVNTSGQHSALSTYTQWVNGNSPLKEIASSESENLPEFFALQQNYPNPFNPSTQIAYTLPEKATVTLRVYNIMGQEVAALINSDMVAGFHEVTFDAGSLSSGVYIAKLTAEGNSGKVFTKELKMQLVK